jgi:effector-binding domain-containing protein
MKKSVIVFGLFLIFLCSSIALQAAQSGSVSLQKVEPFSYFFLRYKGSFDQIQNAIGQLVQEMQMQNVVPAGPLMGIYYNGPEEVKPEQLEWEIGFPVTPQALIQPPLQKKEWNYIDVASCLHTGPYEKTSETIRKMLEWMDANGYAVAGPIMERYMDMNPAELKPEQLKTEIWIPCKKKGA